MIMLAGPVFLEAFWEEFPKIFKFSLSLEEITSK